MPDPSTFFQDKTKHYTVHIALTENNPALRPGMTTSVSILADSRENVLSVPVSSVATYDKTHHLAVKTPDGKIDWRDVTFHMTNGTLVEVKHGLKPGETIILDPAPFQSETQNQKMPPRPPHPAATHEMARTTKRRAGGVSPCLRFSFPSRTGLTPPARP